MGQRDALGPGGGARGVQEERDVGGVRRVGEQARQRSDCRSLHLRRMRRQRPQVRARGGRDRRHEHGRGTKSPRDAAGGYRNAQNFRRRRRCFGLPAAARGREQDQLRFRILDVELELVLLVGGVQRRGDGAGAGDGEEGDDEVVLGFFFFEFVGGPKRSKKIE